MNTDRYINKFSKPKSDLKDKVLDIRRVARVVAGGKRLRFRTTVVVGDERGRVGVGIGKGADVAQSVAKAKTDAQKNLITVPLNNTTIPHEVEAKFSAAHVRIKPAVKGHGLRAGGAVRAVLSLAGIKDVSAKCLGRTPNKLTNALAAIEALKKLKIRKRPGHRLAEPVPEVVNSHLAGLVHQDSETNQEPKTKS